MNNIWIFSDAADGFKPLAAVAKTLGGKISAFALVNADGAKTASGADEVFCLGEKAEGRMVEDYAQTMANTVASGATPTLVLLPATRSGKAIAAKLSAALKAGLVNDAVSVAVGGDGKVEAGHRVYGGLAIQTEVVETPVAVVTVASGATGSDGEVADTDPAVQTLEFVAPKHAVRCVGVRAKEGSSVQLDKAARVVGIGRGIAAEADIKMVEELGAAMGAELGCSRPVAEGEQWMERARYIGVSGVMLKPDIYVAIGISGQIQHMVGVADAKTIVAINKDKNAPVFQFADVGIVGDLYKIVPKLTEGLKG
jgi:electron transfer flavoprotein alpha subunit